MPNTIRISEFSSRSLPDLTALEFDPDQLYHETSSRPPSPTPEQPPPLAPGSAPSARKRTPRNSLVGVTDAGLNGVPGGAETMGEAAASTSTFPRTPPSGPVRRESSQSDCSIHSAPPNIGEGASPSSRTGEHAQGDSTAASPSKGATERTSFQRLPFSLWDYLREEVTAVDLEGEEGMKGDRVANFLNVPMRVEKVRRACWFV